VEQCDDLIFEVQVAGEPRPTPGRVTLVRCIGCGTIDASEECLGICEDRRLALVAATDLLAAWGADRRQLAAATRCPSARSEAIRSPAFGSPEARYPAWTSAPIRAPSASAAASRSAASSAVATQSAPVTRTAPGAPSSRARSHISARARSMAR
jgi:hypothetical protein